MVTETFRARTEIIYNAPINSVLHLFFGGQIKYLVISQSLTAM